MLKNKLIAGAVFALAMFVTVSTVSAADLGTVTLKVGSKGAAVTALQQALGVTPATGYFGSITKAKVIAFQASKGLKADGVVGAATKAAINNTTTATTGCPAGALFNPTTGAACTTTTTTVTGCTAGALFSSTTGQACGTTTSTITTSGEGSATVTYAGVPSDNLAVNKGETKDVIGLKVKATGSDMKVTRLWLDLKTGTSGGTSPRIWLAADKMFLKDGATVIATVDLNSSTVTEVTTGSEYKVEFNGLNFVVAKDTSKVLTVAISRPLLTTNSGTIKVVGADSSIRVVDGAGITDTVSLSSDRTLNLANVTAAKGTLTATLSSNSPVAMSVSGLSSTSGVTTAVKLMDFDLKATDGAVNVNDISGTLTTARSTDVASLELRDGSTVIDSVTAGATFDFNDLSIDVAQDTTKTLSVYAIVNNIGTGAVTAGDGISALVNNVDATTGTDFADASIIPSVTGNTMYLFKYAPALSLGATSATTDDESTSTTINKGGNYSLAFTVAAPAGNDIWVNAADLNASTGITRTNTNAGASVSSSYAVSGTSQTVVTSGYEKIPAGTSRTFTVTANVVHGGTAGYTGVKLARVIWNTVDSATGAVTQDWGLADFKTGTVQITAN